MGVLKQYRGYFYCREEPHSSAFGIEHNVWIVFAPKEPTALLYNDYERQRHEQLTETELCRQIDDTLEILHQ